jgi:hypothetical protein
MKPIKMKSLTERKSGDTSRSTKAEQVLAILINNQDIGDFKKFLSSKDESAKFLVEYFNTYKIPGNIVDVYTNLAQKIKTLSIEPNASQLGSSQYVTTPQWQEYGGNKKLTSKTDVYAGVGYSVKNASTQVRILDAAAPQLKALCMVTIEDPSTGVSSEIKEKVLKSLNNIVKTIKEEGGTISKYAAGGDEKLDLDELRKVTTKAVKKIIDQYDENTNKLNLEVNKVFKTLSNNSDFKYKFIYESITGEKAFGGSEATAEYILAWKNDLSDVRLLSMESVARQVISMFKVPQFVSKSSGSRIGKTIQLGFKAAKETEESDKSLSIKDVADDILSTFSGGYMGESVKKSPMNLSESIVHSANITLKKIKMLEYSQKSLLEQREAGIITENWFSDKWQSIKSEGLRYLLSFIKAIIKIVKLAIEKTKDSIDGFMSFFGIVLDVEGSYDEEASITYDQLK